ncbi:MAG: D-aminopeptidase, partial [Verrucomicrobiota bacterium]
RWHGRQILPESWVDLATSRQVSNGSNPTSDWDQGYGFQFWRCRHGAYRGDGAFGQYCIVLPEQDAVVAITSGVRDMQAVLNVVWERLLPALKAKRQSSDPAGRAQLTRRLANLSVRTPSGAATAPVAPLAGRRYVFPDNPLKLEWISVSETSPPGWMVSQSIGGTVSQMSCGYDGWIKGRGHFGTFLDQAIAGSAAWTSEDTLTVKVAATETPFYQTVRLRFQGQEVTREADANVGFGQTRQPSVIGRSE